MRGIICNGDCFTSGRDAKVCVDGESIVGVERDFGAAIVCEARRAHGDGVVTDGKNRQGLVSLCVGMGGVEKVSGDLANFDGGVGDEAIGGVFNRTGDAAAAIAEGEH